MGAYIVKRLALIPLTLFGIMLVNFIFVQIAPGGPVEMMLAKLQGIETSSTSRISGQSSDFSKNLSSSSQSMSSKYQGAKGLPPEIIKEIEKQFGFDKPAHVRFFKMMKDYALFDFKTSFYKDQKVMSLIKSKLFVSVSLGFWSTLIIYLISIPLGIKKAVKEGSKLDLITSWIVVIAYAIPSFLLAVLLVVLFCGGNYFDVFPLRGIVSDNFDDLSLLGKIKDYFWHITLPVITMTVGGFASLTMLTKNSFLDEIKKQYVITARAKGLSEKKVLYGHVFRNAMLIVIAGFPATLINLLFTGSVLIEVIFSLDGIGLLGFEAVMSRDYPVMFATLYFFGLLGLVLNLISDITYSLIDPRIDFEKRDIV